VDDSDLDFSTRIRGDIAVRGYLPALTERQITPSRRRASAGCRQSRCELPNRHSAHFATQNHGLQARPRAALRPTVAQQNHGWCPATIRSVR
jgi:hypothetical protein